MCCTPRLMGEGCQLAANFENGGRCELFIPDLGLSGDDSHAQGSAHVQCAAACCMSSGSRGRTSMAASTIPQLPPDGSGRPLASAGAASASLSAASSRVERESSLSRGREGPPNYPCPPPTSGCPAGARRFRPTSRCGRRRSIPVSPRPGRPRLWSRGRGSRCPP